MMSLNGGQGYVFPSLSRHQQDSREQDEKRSSRGYADVSRCLPCKGLDLLTDDVDPSLIGSVQFEYTTTEQVRATGTTVSSACCLISQHQPKQLSSKSEDRTCNES